MTCWTSLETFIVAAGVELIVASLPDGGDPLNAGGGKRLSPSPLLVNDTGDLS